MSRSSDDLIESALATIPRSESLVGLFVSQTGNIATVDQGTSRLLVKSITQVPCRVGDPVRLEWRNGALVMLGPTVPRATRGRVTATGNPATVEYPPGSGVTASLPVMNGVLLSVNDIVLLDWSSGGLIVGRIGSPVNPTAPNNPGGGSGQRLTQQFDANDSGSYQSGYGWRTNDVWSSASNSGGWFYGSKIRDTIPDNAVIESASIFLPLVRQTGAAPFGRHGDESRPGGALSITVATDLSGRSGVTPIPTSLIDHLKANPGGLGFASGGYHLGAGTQADGRSGQLTVTYTT